MNRNGTRPRRLRVSALAAVANPSYTRIDTWNLLDDACRHLAEVDLAGLDKAHELARVKRLMDRIGAYERYWLYPGAENLATFRGHLESLSTVRLSRRGVAGRATAERIRRPRGLFDTSAPLADQELVARAKQQQFYTVLLADDAPVTAPESLAECLRALHDPADDVQFELLVVTERRGRHHRGRVERRDPGRDRSARPAAAVPRPGAADEHAARAQRFTDR